MTLLIIMIVVLAIAAVAAWLVRPRPTSAPAIPSVRVEECDVCGEPVAMDVAHVLADVEPDSETGGGTAMVATYCAEHCPGGCKFGCCTHEVFSIEVETVTTMAGDSHPIYLFRCAACGRALPSTPERVAIAETPAQDHFRGAPR